MKESGDRNFSAETEEVMEVSRNIVNSMKNYYSIGYESKIDLKEDGERRIEVRVPGCNYVINARRTLIK